MNRRSGLGIVVALVLLLGAIGLGALAFNAGFSQGVVQGASVVAPEGGTQLPLYGRGLGFFYPRPFGFGFGLFGLLFFGFFILLVVGLVRRVFWHGPMGPGGWWGRMGGPAHPDQGAAGVPPMFQEWHRRAHAHENEPPVGENKPPQA